ncbi:hypothetical protein [Pedobacter sp. D749]|uniref:hypothetical protein n=1 Tax=Pedobacter sp. D749 TaxID=2856523 RepID=UPI001C59CC1D|nr:hypothetical protein [Pedobacter sp. D749]QXU42073.1 hypothetical protein KYH19_00270 [Pedobacter sp. D749]
MLKYILTSPKFTGSVTFGYDSGGFLVYFLNETEMTPIQKEWLLRKLPLGDGSLKEISKLIEGDLKEVPADLSFETFWDKYDKKINRKRTEPMWKKMPDAERMAAIMNIKPYDSYLQRTGIGKAHPENYLKKEYFNVEWHREK